MTPADGQQLSHTHTHTHLIQIQVIHAISCPVDTSEWVKFDDKNEQLIKFEWIRETIREVNMSVQNDWTIERNAILYIFY